MKSGSRLLFVALCFASGAIASTHTDSSMRVQRFSDPVLCYLDSAANDSDAILIRAELGRREVTCTTELKSAGRHAVERVAGLARLQATSNSLLYARAAREIRDRQEVERMARCSRQPPQSYC